MLQPKIKNKVKPTLSTSGSPQVDEERNWLINWYSKRKLPDAQLDKDYQEEKSKYVEKAKQAPNPIVVGEIDNDPDIKGSYVADRNEIAIREDAPQLTYLHEAGHSINDRLRDTKSSMTAYNVISKNIKPQEDIKDEWTKKHYKYLSNYNEVIPRLQAYRKHHNLQPDQEITPELIKENREKFAKPKVFGKEKESIDFEGNTDQLYKVFDDDKLSEVLNKVALNTKLGRKGVGHYTRPS